ncbi:conserved hypothetical protein [Corynebacterium efficiens YS-314]|uniref:Uncharacterized protein n=1 Tax=Corynebacterium efficiens (strain DSM 44549 / YS-314 / AJ 12310 / JCM 11189 / NBRC 100395) TaxID=196164 RepID=Q8FTW6_COREF|nr:conserved hypothetical protein [Corynebacterium efficiens YS-314]
MMDEAGNGLTSAKTSRQRHVQRIPGKGGPHVIGDLPADDLARVGVHHERGIDPPMGGWNIGDVGYPQRVRGVHIEVTVDQVNRTISRINAACGRFLPPAPDPADSFHRHEVLDGAAGDVAEFSFAVDFGPEFAGSVTGVVVVEDPAQCPADLFVPDRPG